MRGRSTNEEPGAPDSRSRNQATALARSAHDPPPSDTIPSTPAVRAALTAPSRIEVGTWAAAPLKTSATTRPSRCLSRWPPSDAALPSVVTSSTRRHPTSRTRVGTSSRDWGPNTSRWARLVWTERTGVDTPLAQQIRLDQPGRRVPTDEAFGPEGSGEHPIRHREEHRVLPDLAGVGPHGRPLHAQPG